MAILVLLVIMAVVALAVIRGRATVRVRAVLLAAAAATPNYAVMLLIFSGKANDEWPERVLVGTFAVVVSFVASVVAVAFLGVPLAWALEKMRLKSSTIYVVAGGSVPLVLYVAYCASVWTGDLEPFGISLSAQIAMEGASSVIGRVLFSW